MEKYEVLGSLGEGSFGRVYKARLISDSTMVALKVISKRGRSVKEIKGLRRECDIQRHLHHPNIIQMLDSFETDNEIVVITEFAHKELTVILSKEGYLAEERVQTIVWDLVSALYYLHSHRVLHRDLKPQNILLDSRNKAKLCDFGFARNMSTGTHVLTSIKGTPLYMAPELIEEHPYDHSADLWSLGCIIYELLVGAPPFCTTSILHLIRMIRHEHIQFPTFLSDHCISFLKGLLQKDPLKRLSWTEILKHPFMKGHILILDDIPSKPLTRPLSIDTLEAKEQQRKNCLTLKTVTPKGPSSQISEAVNTQKTVNQTDSLKSDEACSINKLQQDEKISALAFNSFDDMNGKPSTEFVESIKGHNDINKNLINNEISINGIIDNTQDELTIESNLKQATSKELINNNLLHLMSKSSVGVTHFTNENYITDEESSPLENEEWMVFLQHTIEEVMSGEIASLCQSSLANISMSPLRNSNASSKVIKYVVSLFSLPFVIENVSNDNFKQMKKVYIDLKLVSNLVCASKLLFKSKNRELDDLQEEDLEALERIYLLICHLVHLDDKFLRQFCKAALFFSMWNYFKEIFLLLKKRTRVVVDLMAILVHILRRLPTNIELICEILLTSKTDGQVNENINFIQLLKHSNSLLRERTCYFLQNLGKASDKTLEIIWNDSIKDTLEALIYDSMANVRNAAEVVVEDLKKYSFYEFVGTNSNNSLNSM